MNTMKSIYRYFARTIRPSDIPPFFEGLVSVNDYPRPVDSGNGKKMYGFIDVKQPIDPAVAQQFDLELAPVSPFEILD